jgi:hypothetical protein
VRLQTGRPWLSPSSRSLPRTTVHRVSLANTRRHASTWSSRSAKRARRASGPTTFTSACPRLLPHPPPRNVRPPLRSSRRLPPPKPPLQRGEAGGVTVTAGRNGVAVFDTSNARTSVRKLIAGRAVNYDCFSYMRYHQDAPAELDFSCATRPRVAIRTFGLANTLRRLRDPRHLRARLARPQPVAQRCRDCLYGARPPLLHRPRCRSRACLFVRSREMHRLRKLSGETLHAALATRYGAAITRLHSANAPLPPNRIGYVIRPDGVFHRAKPNRPALHRRRYPRRIARQNVKPLGFVF